MARDDFTIEKFMSARKAELLNYTGKAIEGGRIERRGSLRRLNDEDLEVLKLGYKEPTESSFTLNDIEYEQSVRANFLNVASILKDGDRPSYGTEPATAQDIAVFRALCSTLAEFTRDVDSQEFPAVLGLARLKDSKDYGIGFSGKNTGEWPASKSKNPTLHDFSVPPCYSAFYSAVTCALKEMLDTTLPDIGMKDTKLFLADPRLLLGSSKEKNANVCGACRAVLSARLQDHGETTEEFWDGDWSWESRDWDLVGIKYPVARNDIYQKAMVLETTAPFYTSDLVTKPIQTGVDGYYTDVNGVIEKKSEKTPKRRNSGASLMTSCNICKSERASNAT